MIRRLKFCIGLYIQANAKFKSRNYIQKLLEKFEMSDCNKKATTLNVDLNLVLLECTA